MEDRELINNSLKTEKHFPEFFSVLLPELGRPQYLTKCLDSIHKYADMPVEIIVHDDGSGAGKQQKIIAQRERISTLVLNHGHNMGLARSFNRCRAMATSPYLLGFNTDTYMTSPFLRNMKTALDLPYVGVVNVVEPGALVAGPGTHITPDGIKIRLSPFMGNCHAFGARAEVWDEIGGWNEYVQTTASDVGYMGYTFGAGYFSVRVEGTVINEMWSDNGVVNTRESNEDYVSAAEFTRDDINVPPIFGIEKATHDLLCRSRWLKIYDGVNKPRLQDLLFPSWHNTNFVIQECRKLFRNANVEDIDWDFAKTYGHDKWKDQIINDFNLG
jgi:glycosyltransferase involved in cell wall biosynthesis